MSLFTFFELFYFRIISGRKLVLLYQDLHTVLVRKVNFRIVYLFDAWSLPQMCAYLVGPFSITNLILFPLAILSSWISISPERLGEEIPVIRVRRELQALTCWW